MAHAVLVNAAITVDRHLLHYRCAGRELSLSVEWSGVSKTADCPIDFEIHAGELTSWTIPAGEPIRSDERETILDEIAEHYSSGPVADIIGNRGELLRGQSTFRFSLQIPPSPSRYYEVGRFLAVPMVNTTEKKIWEKKYIADFTGITHWTEPRVPLSADHLAVIARRIVAQQRIGVVGLP